MANVVDVNLDLLEGSVNEGEKEVLVEYQKLAKTLRNMRETLEQVNDNVNVIVGSLDDTQGGEKLSNTIQELEREMAMLNGAFKNAVHKVLVKEDINAVESA